MQTQVQKENSVRLWNWVLKVNNVNIGLVKDAGLETETLVGQIKGHNGKLPPRQKLNGVKFKATMLEINFENLNQIYGWDFSSIAGTPVAVTNEAHGVGWVIGTPIKLNNKNGDNSVVASISIKAWASTLVLNTDYRVYVADGNNWEKGFTYIIPLTTQTLAITANYTYTPFEKKVITYNDLIKAITMYPVEFINTDANGKEFGVRIFQAYATNGLSLSFASDEELEASMEVPIEFGAYPNENNQYFEIIDEQDVTA